MSSDRLVDPSRVELFRFQDVRQDPKGPLPGRADPDGHRQRDLSEIERDAFQKGHEAGERSGLKMAERKVETVLRRFAASLEDLAVLRSEIVKKTEKDLVELALQIARKLIQREIQIDQEIIVTLVRVALGKLIVKNKVTIVVHPFDCEFLKQNIPALQGEKHDVELILKASDELNRGDCLIESDCGNIDARISEQFNEIERGLLSGF
jgi:flagellar assembly protein FliH